MKIDGAMLHDKCMGTGFIEKDGKATACIECMGSGVITVEVELDGCDSESEDC